MKIYKKLTTEPHSFLTIDTKLPTYDPLDPQRFKPFSFIIK